MVKIYTSFKASLAEHVIKLNANYDWQLYVSTDNKFLFFFVRIEAGVFTPQICQIFYIYVILRLNVEHVCAFFKLPLSFIDD